MFEEDRIFAEAFAIGGLTAEREARKKWKDDQEEERRRNHEAFRAMIDGAKWEKHIAEEREAEALKYLEHLSQNSSEMRKLDTYFTSGDLSDSQSENSRALKESDSINRTTPKDSETQSESKSNSKFDTDQSVTEKGDSSTNKDCEDSETSSVKSSSNNSVYGKKGEDTQKILEGSAALEDQKENNQYLVDFENHLSELD